MTTIALGGLLAVVLVAYGAIVLSAGRSGRELAWTIIPALLLMALIVYTASSVGVLAPP